MTLTQGEGEEVDDVETASEIDFLRFLFLIFCLFSLCLGFVFFGGEIRQKASLGLALF